MLPSPSTVVTSRPCAWTANIRHERTGSPSTRTVHAPQTPCSQPTCVPVKPRSWRRKSLNRVRAFEPRFSVRGPLRRDRVFVAQDFQFRYVATPVKSLTGEPAPGVEVEAPGGKSPGGKPGDGRLGDGKASDARLNLVGSCRIGRCRRGG